MNDGMHLKGMDELIWLNNVQRGEAGQSAAWFVRQII
jgi:hypothetical protein